MNKAKALQMLVNGDKETRVGYLVKYALTQGISTVEVEGVNGVDISIWSHNRYTYYIEGKDIVFSKESAIAKAEEMRVRKLQCLNKQIKKISTLKFEIKTN